MWNNIRTWIKRNYNTTINSIAFYPAIIALVFLLISILAISFDFSATGKHLKSQLHWLSLKDATTARSIISSIVAGIISLTVFSFSMVMIVLNQTASQMSNRILDKLIGNRFQQMVLGIYIGTIVYALFLLSTIRDVDSGVYIPALSTYLLILLTVFDIFLFIYFLHYITQTVKYEVIINKILKQTQKSLELSCTAKEKFDKKITLSEEYTIYAPVSGIYSGFLKDALINKCEKYNCIIKVMLTPGTFILKGLPMLQVNKKLSETEAKEIENTMFLHDTETIDDNFYYGIRQLTEVAIKALSPGINDPATAIESLRALFKLFSYRICNFPNNIIKNKENIIFIVTNELSFEEIFSKSILPIWDYGKNDRMIQHELQNLLHQMEIISPTRMVENLLNEVNMELKKRLI